VRRALLLLRCSARVEPRDGLVFVTALKATAAVGTLPLLLLLLLLLLQLLSLLSLHLLLLRFTSGPLLLLQRAGTLQPRELRLRGLALIIALRDLGGGNGRSTLP
jgi:hypothetical protein